MFYKFKLGHNAVEATRNICCAKGEDAINYATITRWFKKFCLRSKKLDDQVRSDRSKTVDSKAMLQAIEANPSSNTWRVSGRFSILQSSVACHLHDLGKSIWCSRLLLILPKYCKTFDSP